MGLSSALYSGTSGISAHGEKMSVIGNNLSNVNTLGFKKSRMHFEDALSQNINTAAGTGQVGRGVAIGAVMSDFSQGSMESTNEATDLAIGGDGFFIVSPKSSGNSFYTRAGNFRFDKEGYLVDPHGYVVQGWKIQEQASSDVVQDANAGGPSGIKTEGVPLDIQLENFQSPPQATNEVNIIANLDSQSQQGSAPSGSGTDSPLFAMFDKWDATEDEPLGDTSYAYQSTIKVYDQNGEAHNLTAYFDPVEEDLTNSSDGEQHWEYLITVPPDDDKRLFWDTAGNTNKKGLLMAGSLKFNSSGQLSDMSAFTITQNAVDNGADPEDLDAWEAAQFNQDGYPVCTANFRGDEDADFTAQSGSDGNAVNMAINLGIKSDSSSWDSNSDVNLSGMGADVDALPSLGAAGETQALACTNYATGSTTVTQSQDGYESGFLQNISVDRDGVVTGNYSNGQQLELYVLTLANFNNTQGLEREGGNLFSETRASGQATSNIPGTGGLGVISSNSLEQSNVDISEEFVKMIITEKGFQANSRTITTTDTMLQEVINLKR